MNSKLFLFALLAFCFSIAPAFALTTPIHEWRFDEGTGSVAIDTAGASNCTLFNSPTYVSGVFGTAIAFDSGLMQYADCGNDSTFNLGSSPYAFSFWIRTEAMDAPFVFTKMNNDYGTHFYNIDINPSIEFVIFNKTIDSQSSDYDYFASTTPLNDGLWHNVVVQKNDTYYSVFIDGLQEILTTDHNIADVAQNINASNTDPFFIGAVSNLPAFGYMNGTIDELRMWSDALNAEEIENLYLYNNITSSEPDAGEVDISSCMDLTTSNVKYDLNQSLTSNDSYCFFINANNVSLECNGNTIDGLSIGASGIIVNASDVTITGCNIHNFISDAGIQVGQGYSNHFSNLNIHGNRFIGDFEAFSVTEALSGLTFHDNIVNSTAISESYPFTLGAGYSVNLSDVSIFNNIFMTVYQGSLIEGAVMSNLSFNDSTSGNYWGLADRIGYSDTCINTGGSVYCNNAYDIFGDATYFDYHPLTHQAPAQVPETLNINTILSSTGGGLGNLLMYIANPFGNFILLLGVIAGALAIVYAIAYTIKNSFN